MKITNRHCDCILFEDEVSGTWLSFEFKGGVVHVDSSMDPALTIDNINELITFLEDVRDQLEADNENR